MIRSRSTIEIAITRLAESPPQLFNGHMPLPKKLAASATSKQAAASHIFRQQDNACPIAGRSQQRVEMRSRDY